MFDGIPLAEIDASPSLVRTLLAEQHPDLSNRPLTDVGCGWDNRLYRLGDDLLVRLPRRAIAAPLIEHEQQWLPVLAPHLPLTVPAPLRVGRPGSGFPWSWSVTPWLIGTAAAVAPPDDLGAAAVDLGLFVRALHEPAPHNAPANPVRGGKLADRAKSVHDRATQLEGLVNRAAVLALWDQLAQTPDWSGPPLWIHGDLHPGNLLVRDGRLTAVIDFGDLTAGDPATDLSVAWMLFPPLVRTVFRDSARESGNPIDDATWTRARGWALALGLAFLANSRDSKSMRAIGTRAVGAVLDEPFSCVLGG